MNPGTGATARGSDREGFVIKHKGMGNRRGGTPRPGGKREDATTHEGREKREKADQEERYQCPKLWNPGQMGGGG